MAAARAAGRAVLYGDFPEHGIVYLFDAYPKSEKEDITDAEKKILKDLMGQINTAWRKRNEKRDN